jgi:hypothetical protein
MNSQNFLDDERMRNMLRKLSEEGKKKLDSRLLGSFEYDCQVGRVNKPGGQKIFTPTKFSLSHGNEEPSIDFVMNLVRKKADKERYKNRLANLSIFNWLEAYNKLNENRRLEIFPENKLVNVYDTMADFFCEHSFNSKDECIVCEVAEVKIIDSLQVLQCKVIFFTKN